MQQNLQNKAGLVEGVFNKVYDKYDLMNDFMSFGIHRVWKKNLMNWMNPTKNKKYLDVACGTGDLGKLFLDYTDKNGEITSSDSNKKMIEKGKRRLKNYKNIKWVVAEAEKLPFENNTFDFYTISFGLRNTKNLNKSLSEAYRVLKPGGRYMCLEFSKIQNSNLEFLYKNYSKLIPDSFSKILNFNTKKLIDSLERIAVLADQQSSVVKIKLDETDLASISADAQDIGNANESIPVSYSGENFDIAFNVRYLLEGLKVIASENVLLKCNIATTPAVFVPEDNFNSFSYLVMPVQVRSYFEIT